MSDINCQVIDHFYRELMILPLYYRQTYYDRIPIIVAREILVHKDKEMGESLTLSNVQLALWEMFARNGTSARIAPISKTDD